MLPRLRSSTSIAFRYRYSIHTHSTKIRVWNAPTPSKTKKKKGNNRTTKMHFTSLTSLAVLTTAATAGPLGTAFFDLTQADISNLLSCHNKNPGILQVVDSFCAQNNIEVPSDYAFDGSSTRDGRFRITISDNGCHGQWVPKHWCRVQFWETCAQGDQQGAGMRQYNGCQVFAIQKTEACTAGRGGGSASDSFRC